MTDKAPSDPTLPSLSSLRERITLSYVCMQPSACVENAEHISSSSRDKKKNILNKNSLNDRSARVRVARVNACLHTDVRERGSLGRGGLSLIDGGAATREPGNGSVKTQGVDFHSSALARDLPLHYRPALARSPAHLLSPGLLCFRFQLERGLP